MLALSLRLRCLYRSFTYLRAPESTLYGTFYVNHSSMTWPSCSGELRISILPGGASNLGYTRMSLRYSPMQASGQEHPGPNLSRRSDLPQQYVA